MKKLLAVVFTILIMGIHFSKAQSLAEQSLYQELTTDDHEKVSSAALDRVLKTPEDYSAGILYPASAVAFQKQRLEDAGFLFYSAIIRKLFDKALFPPTGTGGNNPLLAFGAFESELSPSLQPSIYGEPKIYAKIIARLKTFKPAATVMYDPGWEYLKRGNEKEVAQNLATDCKKLLDGMSRISILLSDKDYFNAFKISQAYILKPKAADRPTAETYETALQVMARIEKQKGIEGFSASTRKRGEQIKAFQSKVNEPKAK